jgi:hypothetical protein
MANDPFEVLDENPLQDKPYGCLRTAHDNESAVSGSSQSGCLVAIRYLSELK